MLQVQTPKINISFLLIWPKASGSNSHLTKEETKIKGSQGKLLIFRGTKAKKSGILETRHLARQLFFTAEWLHNKRKPVYLGKSSLIRGETSGDGGLRVIWLIPVFSL